MTKFNNVDRFKVKLREYLEAESVPQEISEKVIRAALDVEFGPGFTSHPSSAKMIKTLAAAISRNLELKEKTQAAVELITKEA